MARVFAMSHFVGCREIVSHFVHRSMTPHHMARFRSNTRDAAHSIMLTDYTVGETDIDQLDDDDDAVTVDTQKPGYASTGMTQHTVVVLYPPLYSLPFTLISIYFTHSQIFSLTTYWLTYIAMLVTY